MRNETPVTVVGTVVRNEDRRRVGEDQRMVLNLRVAANERRFDRGSGRWVDGDTLYLRVNCWRNLAENAASLLVGDPVIVTGRLRTKEWVTEQGDRRSQVELEASALGPDLSRCTVTGVRKTRRDERPGDEPSADGPPGDEPSADGPPGRERPAGDGPADSEPGAWTQPSAPEPDAHPPGPVDGHGRDAAGELAERARPLAPAGA